MFPKVIVGSERAFVPIGPCNLVTRPGYANLASNEVINLGNEIENLDEDEWDPFHGGLEHKLGAMLAPHRMRETQNP